MRAVAFVGESVTAGAISPKGVVASDGFAAVSGEEIQRLTLEAQRQAEAQAAQEAANSRVRSGASSTPGVRQEGDDYPWAFELTDDQGGGFSPLNYYYRECAALRNRPPCSSIELRPRT